MDWFKVGYLLVFQLGLDCLVRHSVCFVASGVGYVVWLVLVLARAHRRPLCRSISVVYFTGWARAAYLLEVFIFGCIFGWISGIQLFWGCLLENR